MKISRVLVSLAIAAIMSTLIGILPAKAASYYWANTKASFGSVTVRYCDGKTALLKEGTTVSKDVCAVRQDYDRQLYVEVKETGTALLYPPLNCGSPKWFTFNSKSDTSRTALVSHYVNNPEITGQGCA